MVAGVMLWRVAAHPLATDGTFWVWLVFYGPYALLGTSALLSYSRTWMLISILFVTALIFLMNSAGCLAHTEMALRFLDAQAAGRHLMACGPPPALLVLPIVYLASFVTFVVSLGLWPLQICWRWPAKAAPRPIPSWINEVSDPGA
jgi:hypothetical protein